MWSSNTFLVIKPDEEENAGPAPDNDYGSEANSNDGEGAEKPEAINAESKKNTERLNQFYIIKRDGTNSQELVVNNWIHDAEGENAEEENQIVQALFGKDILVVIKKFKIYYAHVNFQDLIGKGVHNVEKKDTHSYDPNGEDDDTNENLVISVANATEYMTKQIPYSRVEQIEFQFALTKKDQQLHFVKCRISF